MYSSIKKRRKKSNKDHCISIRSIVHSHCFSGHFKPFYIINTFAKYTTPNPDSLSLVCSLPTTGKYPTLGLVKFGLEPEREAGTL